MAGAVRLGAGIDIAAGTKLSAHQGDERDRVLDVVDRHRDMVEAFDEVAERIGWIGGYSSHGRGPTGSRRRLSFAEL